MNRVQEPKWYRLPCGLIARVVHPRSTAEQLPVFEPIDAKHDPEAALARIPIRGAS
jgi:hypothetical protein